MNNKLKILISTIVVLIVSNVLLDGGGLFGQLICRPLTHSSNGAVAFAGMYASFIGIWIAGLALLYFRKKNRKFLVHLGTKSKGNKFVPSLAAGLALGMGLNLIVAFVAMLHGDIHLTFNGINIPLILLFILSVTIQSGAEEFVCRLYMYRKLEENFKKYPLVWILGNGVFFGVMHLGNPGVTAFAILNIVLVGILYSLVIYYFDSFWTVVVAHASWNFCQNILLGLPNSGIVSEYSIFKLDAANAASSFAYSTAFGIEGTILTDVLLVVAIIVVVMIGRKKKEQERLAVANKEEACLA